MIFGSIILFTALTLSAVAAYYSIIGLVAIFSAAPIPIMIMGGALEVGKIVSTVFLHNNWKRLGWAYKSYLIPAVLILMLLTSLGIFGLLSKAHSDQSLVTGDATSKVAIYDEKIATERENIAQAKKALEQMNAQVDQMLGRTDSERGTDKAVIIRKQQAKERALLQAEITRSQKVIQQLQAERAPFAAEARKVEAEVGPIKYIAALLYGDNPDQNILERAVRWVIILIVVVFDPLALTLILAANKQFEWARAGRGGWVHDEEEKTVPAVTATEEPKTESPPNLESTINDDVAAMSINPNPPGIVQRPWTEEELTALNELDKKVNPDNEADEFFERARFAAEAADILDEQHRAEKANAEAAKIEKDEPDLDIPVLENEEMWASRVIDEHQKQANYEADDGPLTDDQISQIKASVENLPPAITPEQQKFIDEAPAVIEDLTYELQSMQADYKELESYTQASLTKNLELTQELEKIKVQLEEAEAARNVEMQRANNLNVQLMDLMHPTEKVDYRIKPIADNLITLKETPSSSFGSEFPTNPNKGDLFLRTDYLPTKLFKFNGDRWIELDKSNTDSYTYNDSYLEFLIEKLKSGEYDKDDLNDVEQEQIAQYLQGKNGIK